MSCNVASCPTDYTCNASGKCQYISGAIDQYSFCCPSNAGVCGQLKDSKYSGVCSPDSIEPLKPCQENKECRDDKHPSAFCQGIVDSKCDSGENNGKSCYQDDCPASGTCEFNDLRYYSSAQYMWSPPKQQCGFVSRPKDNHDYCGIPPRIEDIKVNGKDSGVELAKGGFATLTFTSHIDPNQLPITGYTIDWDDGTTTIATGIKINQNSSENNPHTFYHYYSYWDVKNNDRPNDCIICDLIDKEDGINYCAVTPKIQITDNWNWHNDFALFKGTIKIKER